MGKSYTKTLYIDGMTCVSCENRIERALKKTPGVVRAKVSYQGGTAVVSYDEEMIGIRDIERIVENLDYTVRKSPRSGGNSAGKTDITRAAGFAVVVIALYFIVSRLGGFNIFNAFPEAKAGMDFGMLFVIGLLTSVHCVAMCGGINLSQCVGVSGASTRSTKLSALRPGFLYNLGRVISYTVVGGIVGAIGSVIALTGAMQGIVQIAAGVFMVIMGANMTGIFPFLRKLTPRLPKAFAGKSEEARTNKGPLIVGLLNGLMPCGPLQAMQLYALSTGSPLLGALSMLFFSLGTVPLMFGLGALSSLLSKRFTKKMMAVSAVLVAVLGISMFSSGLSLSGFAAGTAAGAAKPGQQAASVSNGVQVITTRLKSNRYEPITVTKGVPVKWVIKADAANINGCNNKIVISKLNIQKKLVPGDNVIEFTPVQTGVIPYSCWMGMIRSSITVVDGGAASSLTTQPDTTPTPAPVKAVVPSERIAVAKIVGGVQTVKIGMDNNGFSPAVIVLQKGVETKWVIEAGTLDAASATVLFPLYDEQRTMKKGANDFSLYPVSDFDFYTQNNAFFGFVKVVDDLKKVNLSAIREELKGYTPTPWDEGGDGTTPSCCQ